MGRVRASGAGTSLPLGPSPISLCAIEMALDSKIIVEKFLNVASLAGDSLNASDITIEELKAPHQPTGLPVGSMAVYVFSLNGKTLKVGKAGSNSDARFRSQHYNPKSAASTLAASILKDPAQVGNPTIDIDSVGRWIRENTDRTNYILKADIGIEILTLLESFLQCLLKPVYEGFSSQRRA